MINHNTQLRFQLSSSTDNWTSSFTVLRPVQSSVWLCTTRGECGAIPKNMKSFTPVIISNDVS